MGVLLLLIGILPPLGVAEDRVDVIERLHLYDANGDPVAEYLIFWHWHADYGEHHVRAWRGFRSGCEPVRSRCGWSILWQDADVLRRVDAITYRERWEQYDPELADRECYPEHWRVDLKPAR